MSFKLLSSKGNILLHHVSWPAFQKFLKEKEDQGGRITYDRGELEIMAPSFDHESVNSLAGRLIELLTEELDIKMKSAGSTTFQREDLERGLEPDKCYYIANEKAVRGKRKIDLSLDPPPDLAIEVEVTKRAIKRMPIYAALGVREVWRIRRGGISIFHLDPDGQYQASGQSAVFPFLPMDEFARFIQKGVSMDETSLIQSFRGWVRQRLKK